MSVVLPPDGMFGICLTKTRPESSSRARSHLSPFALLYSSLVSKPMPTPSADAAIRRHPERRPSVQLGSSRFLRTGAYRHVALDRSCFPRETDIPKLSRGIREHHLP